MYNLVISKVAALELAESKSFYNKRKKGLGENFGQALLELLERIIANPIIYPTVYLDIRKVVLKRFPFVILYAIENDKTIIILHVFHASRNPNIWKK